jgi:GTP:adenosylcobinamide-phosphate guanylyltransferase
LIPSCGDGLRFKLKKNENFKPLIKVNEDFMIIKTLKSLPKSKKNVVVMRNDHNKKYSFKSKITKKFPKLETLILNKKTDGMASTCFQYLKNTELKTPLIISSCDYAVIFDEEKFSNLLKFYDPEVVVWTFKNILMREYHQTHTLIVKSKMVKF